MPENATVEESLVTSDSLSGQPMTAGKLLKAARLAAGLHLGVLSVNLKVSVRQLEALEADQYPSDQSPVFARGLAASFCRQLRIDPAPILALMPLSANYLQPNGFVRHARLAPSNFRHMNRSATGLPLQASLSAVGMLLLIAALIWLPSPAQWAWLDSVAAYVTSPDPQETSTVISPPEATPPASLASESSLLATNVNVPELLDSSSARPAGQTVAITYPPQMASQDTSKAPSGSVGATASELLFSAIDTSWIEVRDEKSQVLWSGILKPGESNRLLVSPRATVVVGRADAVQVKFRGQAFDLKPHSLSNVARFEVKP
jgi:cytoskeleton protein RodZ